MEGMGVYVFLHTPQYQYLVSPFWYFSRYFVLPTSVSRTHIGQHSVSSNAVKPVLLTIDCIFVFDLQHEDVGADAVGSFGVAVDAHSCEMFILTPKMSHFKI